MAGVPDRIVRNFGILKTVLSFPMRPDQYSAGPLDVNLTIKAIRIMGLTSFSDTVYYRAGIENYAHRGYH